MSTTKAIAVPRHRPAFLRVQNLFSRFRNDRRGTALVEFGIVGPLLIGLSLAVVEFVLMGFDYHRASEATRRGARTAAIVATVVDLSGLETSGPYVCVGTASGPDCGSATVETPASFDTILSDMQKMLPSIAKENLRIEYRDSGVGEVDTPAGLRPQITVRLVGLERSFSLVTAVPWLSHTLAYPEFAASMLGNGK